MKGGEKKIIFNLQNDETNSNYEKMKCVKRTKKLLQKMKIKKIPNEKRVWVGNASYSRRKKRIFLNKKKNQMNNECQCTTLSLII